MLVQSLVVSGTRRRPLRPNSPPPDPGAPSAGGAQQNGRQSEHASNSDHGRRGDLPDNQGQCGCPVKHAGRAWGVGRRSWRGLVGRRHVGRLYLQRCRRNRAVSPGRPGRLKCNLQPASWDRVHTAAQHDPQALSTDCRQAPLPNLAHTKAHPAALPRGCLLCRRVCLRALPHI